MTDTFRGFSEGLTSPPSHAFAVTPNDTTDLPNVIRCLNAASAGTVRVTMLSGQTETIFIAAGIAFPIRASRVWAQGTTADGLVGLF